MTRVIRRRKPNDAELRREQLHQARSSAPTLRQFMPAADQVRVELSFDDNEHLAQAPRQFTTFPPAQAHFVYACPFGNCDGVYDLNPTVLQMLREHACQASGMLRCAGHKLHPRSFDAQCGLGVTYSVTIRYAAATPGGPTCLAPVLP